MYTPDFLLKIVILKINISLPSEWSDLDSLNSKLLIKMAEKLRLGMFKTVIGRIHTCKIFRC
jgi:hypothetical protein